MVVDFAPSPEPSMSDSPLAPSSTAPPTPLVLKADELFRSGNIVWIEVGQDRYQLRLTRNGKLILTK